MKRLSVYAIYTLFGCSEVLEPVPSEVPASIVALHDGPAADLEIHRDPHTHEITQLAGHFAAPAGVVTPEWIERVLTAMAEERSGLAAREIPELEETDGLRFVMVEQKVAGLRAQNREIVVQLEADAIVGVSGRLIEDASPSGSLVQPDIDRLARRYGMRGFDAERVWDAELGQPVWALSNDDAVLFSDDAGNVVRITSQNSGWYERGRCRIRHPVFDRRNIGTVTEHRGDRPSACGREFDFFSGICTYELSHHPSGELHTLGRVNDHLGAESQVTLGCGVEEARFTSTATVNRRQQNLNYAVERMRTFMFTNEWDHVPATDPSDVQINIEEDACLNIITGENAEACFNHRTSDIYIDRDHAENEGYAHQTIMHEFGHYVNWSFGNFSRECSETDEGDALHETFADIHALISLADDPEYNVRYDTQIELSDHPGHHHDEDSEVPDYNEGDCRPGVDVHDVGVPLVQAMWEIMWNLDCDDEDACVENQSYGDHLMAGIGREAWLEMVGESVARALQNTPSSTTFNEVLHWFLIRMDTLATRRLGEEGGDDVRERVENVLEHHGFNPG
jgi:hypothetical protein